ncbi:MAG: DNA ligase D, partial [Desulforhabdus sp.]|nr:DNA ligase D [Desulforhabdus sp.]
KGEYGGGTVMLWVYGKWEPIGDAREAYRKGRLKFRLHGEKLTGVWILARMSGEAGEEGKNWVLIKGKDDDNKSGEDVDIVKARPLSVASGRSMEEIAQKSNRVWTQAGAAMQSTEPEAISSSSKRSGRKSTRKLGPSTLPQARKSPQPKSFRPQLATLVKTVPQRDEWLFELKYDGYRMLCLKTVNGVRLITRNGNDWTAKFPEIARAVQGLPVEQAIMDGEIVVLREDGSTDFQALQNFLQGIPAGMLVYYLFDLPHYGGYDLTRTPLIERKKFLQRLLQNTGKSSSTLRFGDHLEGHGDLFYNEACSRGLEGIVCKKAMSGYEQKRSRSWIKVKCLKRQEFVIGGYSEPGGARNGFGALLLGYYDKENRLVYAGRVGTGFDESSLKAIASILKSLEQDEIPFDSAPARSEQRGVHWVRPEMVAEVEFAFWTGDGRLRHPSFMGLRKDKPAGEVGREEPELESMEDSSREQTKERQQKQTQPRNIQRRNEMKPTEIAGTRITNPNRVLYSKLGATKLSMARFYEQIAEWILPHIVKRPLTLVRCPQGSERECFYQRHFNEALPKHLHGITVREEEGDALYIGLDGLPGLIGLVQLGVLEIHPWGSREDKLEFPDRLILDLDPDPQMEWSEVVEAARLLHNRLEELALRSFLKTTGGKGLHVVVPLVRRADWAEVKEFAKALVLDMVRRDPHRFVATMSKSKRTGKVFIDYHRNSRSATSVAPYSTRARAGAPVSTPLRWDELSPQLKSDHYNVDNLPRRLTQLKDDPWQDFLTTRQSITVAMKKALNLSQ